MTSLNSNFFYSFMPFAWKYTACGVNFLNFNYWMIDDDDDKMIGGYVCWMVHDLIFKHKYKRKHTHTNTHPLCVWKYL